MRGYENRERTGGLAAGLGWFSIALGAAELTAPRAIARLIGAREDDATASVLQACGAREIANGLAILAQPDRPAWLWTRVGGDVLDLSSLAGELSREDGDRRRLGAAMAAVAGVTALDVLAASRLRSGASERPRGRRANEVTVERVTTIRRPVEEVYAFWRNFENLPRFMRHLESVTSTAGGRSHWRAKGPAGMTVEWDAEIIDERENERISWRSLEGADIVNRGTVRFQHAPAARGTEVRVRLDYEPPAGSLGRAIAWLFGEEPDQQIHEDLHRFKQLMETGEIPLSDGPGMWRPARPAARPEEIKTLAGVAQ